MNPMRPDGEGSSKTPRHTASAAHHPGGARGWAGPRVAPVVCVCSGMLCCAWSLCVFTCVLYVPVHWCAEVCAPSLPPGQSWEPGDRRGPLPGWGARCAEELLQEAAGLQEAEERVGLWAEEELDARGQASSLCTYHPAPGGGRAPACSSQLLAPGQTGPLQSGSAESPGPVHSAPDPQPPGGPSNRASSWADSPKLSI